MILEVQNIDSFYGQSQVLFGMSLAIKEGEVVTLMGRNGMGKTTTIRAIMGLTPARPGTGRSADLSQPHRRGKFARNRHIRPFRQGPMDTGCHLESFSAAQ